MGFPRKLKQMMMYVEGRGYAGETVSVTLPNLSRKLEAYRGGGMARPVKIDMGGSDDLDVEHSYGGPMRDIIRQYGAAGAAGVQLRFAGTYQDDSDGTIHECEIVLNGRHEEIDRGEQKPGEAGEFKVKTACVYYKETWDGEVDVEIDIINAIEIVGGVDLMAEHRSGLGLF